MDYIDSLNISSGSIVDNNQRIYKGHVSNTTGDRDGSVIDLKSVIPDWYNKINLILFNGLSSYTYDRTAGTITISSTDVGGVRTFEFDFIVAII